MLGYQLRNSIDSLELNISAYIVKQIIRITTDGDFIGIVCTGLAEAGLIASNLSGGDNGRENRAVFHPDRYILIRNDDMF